MSHFRIPSNRPPSFAAGEELAELRVEEAGVDARRARQAADEGPALYLAKLVGSDDPEAMVQLITAARAGARSVRGSAHGRRGAGGNKGREEMRRAAIVVFALCLATAALEAWSTNKQRWPFSVANYHLGLTRTLCGTKHRRWCS
jgi:hypothetical protein